MKITFLDAATLGDDLRGKIRDIFGSLGQIDVRLSTARHEVKDAVSDCDAVVVNKIKLNAENLSAAKNLKLICVAATGYDNIDIDYCRTNGIAVCNVRGYSTHSVAQFTLAMAMNLICHMPQYCEYAESGSYTKSGIANCLTPVYHEVCGKTWGIIGAGSIGRQVARVAEAMGCRVIVCKQTPADDLECVTLDELCKTADIISVHVPLTEKTENLIDRRHIEMMKSDAVFINTARGAVTDESALADAIEGGRLGGLGADVYSAEPLPPNHPFNRILRHPNTCFTPHSAWGAYEARVRCLKIIAENIKSYTDGKYENRVDI